MPNQNSNIIANKVAVPPVNNEVGLDGGRVRVVMDTFETIAAGDTAADANGDAFLLARLPSNARIISFKVASDDLDGASDVALNYGLYETDGTVIDEDEFASAVNHQSAVALTEILFEAADISTLTQTLADRAGESNVNKYYDIAATQNANATSLLGATFSFIILYVVD
jgi:hypothetical protein